MKGSVLIVTVMVAFGSLAGEGRAATITVNDTGDNTNDDAVVTLREALLSCNQNADLNDEVAGQRSGSYVTGGGTNGDVIQFDASLYGRTITLSNAAGFYSLPVGDDVRIAGNAGNKVQIRCAAGTFRLLTLAQPKTLQVEGIAFSGGSSQDPAQYPYVGSDTYKIGFGGVACATSGTAMIFSDCLFATNSCQRAFGGGGALYTQGDLTLRSCRFYQNGFSGMQDRGHGATVRVDGASNALATLVVTNCTFSNPTGYSGSDGAAFYGQYCNAAFHDTVCTNFTLNYGNVSPDSGGILGLKYGNLTVVDCTLGDCRNGVFISGGAIQVANGDLQISGSEVYLCGSGYGTVFRWGCGGGIYHAAGNMTISNCLIRNNFAHENTYGEYGGGIYSTSTNLLIVDTSIIDNTNQQYTAGKAGYGGGLYWGGTTAELVNVTISGNICGGTNGTRRGGGIFMNAGTMTLRNCTVVGNSASENGGGIWRQGGTLNLFNTIVAANAGPSVTPVYNDLYGTVASSQNSLVGNTNNATITLQAGSILGPDLSANPRVGVDLSAGYAAANSDVSATNSAAARSDLDSVLTALKIATNATSTGSGTLAHALDKNSVAVNAGNNRYADGTLGGSAIAFDPRGTGYPRIADRVVDLGAYEVQPPLGSRFVFR